MRVCNAQADWGEGRSIAIELGGSGLASQHSIVTDAVDSSGCRRTDVGREYKVGRVLKRAAEDLYRGSTKQKEEEAEAGEERIRIRRIC